MAFSRTLEVFFVFQLHPLVYSPSVYYFILSITKHSTFLQIPSRSYMLTTPYKHPKYLLTHPHSQAGPAAHTKPPRLY